MAWRDVHWLGWVKKTNKYGNVRTITLGHKHDSKYEAKVSEELHLLEQAGEIKSYEKHPTIDLWANGVRVGTYKIDFIVYHNDGTVEYLEAKSKATKTPAWHLKWKILDSMTRDDPKAKMTVVTDDRKYYRTSRRRS